MSTTTEDRRQGMASRSLARVRERAVIPADATPDQVVDVHMWLKTVKRELATIVSAYDEQMVEWLDGGEITVGDVRYYAGYRYTEKVRDLDAAVDAVLTATDGDLGKFIDCLSANALKPAAVGELGPSLRADHFDKKRVPTVKEGKPKKVLKQVNTKFLKGEMRCR